MNEFTWTKAEWRLTVIAATYALYVHKNVAGHKEMQVGKSFCFPEKGLEDAGVSVPLKLQQGLGENNCLTQFEVKLQSDDIII